MDKKLESYMCGGKPATPPFVSAQKIQEILEARGKRRLLIAVSFAALLWMMTLIMLAAWVYKLYPVAAYALSGCLGIGLMASGVFSGLVLIFKKVGA